MMRRSLSLGADPATQSQQQMLPEPDPISVVWRGGLKWTAKLNGEIHKREAQCAVGCRVVKNVPQISGECWPSDLLMQMVPKSVVTTLAQEGLFIASRSVKVSLQDCAAVSSLKGYMQSGFLGCIHIDTELQNLFCIVKIIILHYNGASFNGVIPSDQVVFINRLRQIIQEKRNLALQNVRLRMFQQDCLNGQNKPIEEITLDSDGETEIMSDGGSTQPPLPPENHNVAPSTPNNDNTVVEIIDESMHERGAIWNGTLQWLEKIPGPLRVENILRHVPCQVTTVIINGVPKVTAQGWPPRLVMQLIPKEILIDLCENKNIEMLAVNFELIDCEEVQSLTHIMKSGFAGCVHFSSSGPECNIKLLILLYSKELQCYLGFIPSDQGEFVSTIREVIQKRKDEISLKQAQQQKKFQSDLTLQPKNRNSDEVEVIAMDDSDKSEKEIESAVEREIEQLRTKSKSPNGDSSNNSHSIEA